MPKISVIIPVYKVEQYLPECLESVSRQTFRDFELILVDDGSPDTCGKICDEFAAEHPNTLVIHQENMGVAEARNQGIRAASGEYVVYIDADDYVSEDYLEYLLHLVQTHGTDVAVAAKVYVWDDREPVIPDREPVERVLTAAEALTAMCYNRIDICPWGKICRRELAEKYPYPTGQVYEDVATTYKLIGDTDRVACGNRVIYFWRQRQDSITHAVITRKHLFGITAAQEQLAYMQERYPEAVPAARVRCAMKIVDLAYRLVMGKMDRELFEEIRSQIKPLMRHLMADQKAGRSLKLRAQALSWGYVPFKALSAVYTVALKAVGRS